MLRSIKRSYHQVGGFGILIIIKPPIYWVEHSTLKKELVIITRYCINTHTHIFVWYIHCTTLSILQVLKVYLQLYNYIFNTYCIWSTVLSHLHWLSIVLNWKIAKLPKIICPIKGRINTQSQICLAPKSRNSTPSLSLFTLFVLFKISTMKMNSGMLRKQLFTLDVYKKVWNSFMFKKLLSP